MPVHSERKCILRLTSSAAAAARAAAVLLTAVAKTEASSAAAPGLRWEMGLGKGEDRWRGSNQLP